MAERGLDFADAGKVFAGTVFEFEDERVAYPERRYSTIGMLEDRMVVVIWVDAEDGRRVISMRKANARERTRFERYLA
nr:BrnT family toxin [Sphingomonas sp. H160509]